MKLISKTKNNTNQVEVGLGIDLGGTKVSGALFSADGIIAGNVRKNYLGTCSGDQVADLIAEMITHFSQWAKKKKIKIRNVGVSVPGIYDSMTGNVWAPNIPGWKSYPLTSFLSRQPEIKDMKIRIESDRACYILGGAWKGAAQGCKDAIFMAVGTGIGVGIIANGRVLRGANGIAGAIGWMALSDPYLDEYNVYGCFEAHASGAGLAFQARKKLSESGIVLKGAETVTVDKISAKDLFNAYELNDPVALEVINDAIRYWGKATANLVSLFNPEKIIFGGGVFGPATQLIPQIYAEAKKWGQPIGMKKVEFVPSEFGHDAGLFGAGFLSLNPNYNG
ncbi:ROK family protein [Mariniphaga sediminis]|uniref:ROK family protein n=1 Tax=Mariniphaga sediminis TaxID=1628158 RepID=A0A399D019_9BACT|nr:ROK family protein [Mariniphaga sediminis]RIH64937.1 ROK family protein [Mariniphaga sediminis]